MRIFYALAKRSPGQKASKNWFIRLVASWLSGFSFYFMYDQRMRQIVPRMDLPEPPIKAILIYLGPVLVSDVVGPKL